MSLAGSPKAAARQAAVLFLASGLLAFANAPVPGTVHRLPVVLVGLADVLFGAVAWGLPWDRWPPRASLVLVPPALAVIVFANRFGDVPAYTYGVFFVVVFTWVGVCQPPGTSWLLAPVACLAYVLPFLAMPGRDADGLRSVGVAIPICVLVGELLSRSIRRQHQAHQTVQRSAAALEQALRERDELDRLKRDFVSVVSHELRTPLTSMRGALELLADGVGADKHDRIVHLALTNTDRLIRLSNDLLDLQRLEAGKLAMIMRACSVRELMTTAAQEMQAMGEQAEVQVIVTAPELAVWADPDRIVQILVNLLSNAIKFSPPAGRVWLSAQPQADEVLVEVRDEGPGIPADQLEAVFGRFQQVGASDPRHKAGSGLGLAICRSIVGQHGGRIWVESTIGEGSTFFFALPPLQSVDNQHAS
jgi:signal transduction histidine kinase